ncbi:MAG: ADOP family duplicated permease [Actinomycetota bacterium]
MPDFHALVRERLRNSGISPAREAEIVDEVAEHLSERYEALCSAGNTEQEALATITAQLDQRDLAGELRAVEQAGSPPIPLGAPAPGSFWTALRQDVRYGLRVLRLNPGFTTICVLSLALGIGANTAIFQLIDAVCMRTLPVKDPQELAVIRPTNLRRTGHFEGRYPFMTNALWEQVRARQQGFSGVFAWGNTSFNLALGGQVRYAQGLWVSGGLFDVLGIQPVLGRVLHAGDDHPGCGAPGVVISYAFWQREFGGNPAVTDKTLRLDGHPFPVIGVTPASFYGVDVGHTFDVAAPICSEPVVDGEDNMINMRHAWWLAVMGRLNPGWTLDRAAAQLNAISPAAMQETLPPVYQGEQIKQYLAEKLNAYPGANGFSNLRWTFETPLWVLLTIAGLVLLIACANLANLMLARSTAREREIAVRLALGAARGRLLRQLLTESLLLSAAGALLGIGLAMQLSHFLVHYLSGDPGGTRIFIALAVDWRVLGFATALAVLTCLLFGLVPAWKATSAPPARIMSLAGRGLTTARERFSLRRSLVVLQVALSLVLVVSAMLFAGSLRKILAIDAGFQRDGILIMDADFSALKLPAADRVPFATRLLERVRALPGVDYAAEAFVAPLSGGGWNDYVVVDGKKKDSNVNMNNVSPGYFRTLGAPLLAGRDFNDRDTPGSPKVAIVSQQFARKIFGTENPIGRTFKVDVYRGEAQPEYQVVGLVKDIKYAYLREDFEPLAFYPLGQSSRRDTGIEVIVRSSLGLQPLLESLRGAAAGASPAVVVDFRVLNQQLKDRLLRERLLATLSGFFGALAALLATIGLYGVIAYLVVRRTNEIGIRMALGATPARILAMVVREAAVLLLFGIFAGALLTLAAGKEAAALLYDLKPYDPAIMAAAALGLSAVAIAASLLPARRAAHLQPTVALREE